MIFNVLFWEPNLLCHVANALFADGSPENWDSVLPCWPPPLWKGLSSETFWHLENIHEHFQDHEGFVEVLGSFKRNGHRRSASKFYRLQKLRCRFFVERFFRVKPFSIWGTLYCLNIARIAMQCCPVLLSDCQSLSSMSRFKLLCLS